MNGDANGAYIAVACTNYNGTAARGNFFLEALPMYADWGFAVFKLKAADRDRRVHPMAFVFPNRTVLTMPEQGGLTNPAVVCTAPDCAKAILRRVPEALRSQLQVVFTTGRELLDKLPAQGMDGLMLNPAGPGPTFPLRLPGPGPSG